MSFELVFDTVGKTDRADQVQWLWSDVNKPGAQSLFILLEAGNVSL